MTYRAIVCAAMFIVTTFLVFGAQPGQAAANEPPFCVMRGGGGDSGGSPQVCSYWDYQQCLQAASDMRGNCVQNIDYHGGTAPTSAPGRTRHRR
jgi:hypothetical protein